MTTLTASQARSTLFPLIEAVNQDGGIVTITSKAGNAVLMSADEYAALEETAHLLRSPANAERLLKSLASKRRTEQNLTEQNLTEQNLTEQNLTE